MPSGLIQSLQRGLRVLEFVCAAAQPVVAKQVAAALELNLSTAYHLLNTLVFEGYVRRGEDRTFVASERGVSRLQGRPTAVSACRLKAQRVVGRAAFAIEGTSMLSSLDGLEAVIHEVGHVPGVEPPASVHAGRRHLAHLSVAGRAALTRATIDDARGPQAILDELADTCRERGELFHRPSTEESIDALLAGAAATETSEGFHWMAVPIAARGQCACAIAVGRPTAAVSAASRQEVDRVMATAVRNAAACLSSVIGPATFAEQS